LRSIKELRILGYISLSQYVKSEISNIDQRKFGYFYNYEKSFNVCHPRRVYELNMGGV